MRPRFHIHAVIGVCLLLFSVGDSSADIRGTASLVAPAQADSLASPLTFRTIQTRTEPDTSESASLPTVWFGLDSYIRDGYKLFDLPVSVAISPDLQAQLNVPMIYTTAGSPSDEKTGMQLGDIRLSIKYRTNVDKDYDAYFILTARFPSGDPDSGAGEGSYDFSFTHKSIFTHGKFRTTLMAGVTVPPPFDFTVAGNAVVYSPTIAYMAATERSLFSPGFKFGIKAAGLHFFGSRINSELQKNPVTSLDIIPEVSCRISDWGAVVAGIIVPVITIYDLPGAANKRDPIVNLSVYSYF